MPLIFKEIIDANVTIGVWKITETEAELRKELILSPKDQETILSTRLLQRRLERIACRRAIASLLGQPEIFITYGEKGEPFLPHCHISFSHTKELVAVAVSAQYPVGVDIEKIQEKILGLHSKFVSEKELTPKEFESSEAITRIWTSKEAVYKLFHLCNFFLSLCKKMHVSICRL